jgi:Cell division protein CrgA
MPESRIRRKAAFTAPPPKSAGPKPNPRWWAPTMVTLLLVGLIYIVVFYLSGTLYPVPNIGSVNLVIGFGILLTGFGMTTRWR